MFIYIKERDLHVLFKKVGSNVIEMQFYLYRQAVPVHTAELNSTKSMKSCVHVITSSACSAFSDDLKVQLSLCSAESCVEVVLK